MKRFFFRCTATLVLLTMAASTAACSKDSKPSDKGSSRISTSESILESNILGESSGNQSQTETGGEISSRIGVTSSSSSKTSSAAINAGDKPVVPGGSTNETYDVSGQITNLKGRTIKMQSGIIQTSVDDVSTTEGRKLNAFRKAVETKLNCKLQTVHISMDNMRASILAGDPAADIWNLETIPQFFSAYQSNLIQPIEPLKAVNLGDRAKFSSLTDLTIINGQHWGFAPQTYGMWRVSLNTVLYFNKKLLKGTTANEIYAAQANGTWTWDKFKDIVSKSNAPDSGIIGITDANGNFYNDLMASSNVSWVKQGTKSYTFNGDDGNAKKVMDFYKKLYTDGQMTVNADPAVGKVNTDNMLSSMANDYDLKMFKSGKAVFMNGAAHIAHNKLFGSEINNIGVVFTPKPTATDKYRSYLNHACIVSIPVYGGANAKQKAIETATVIDYLWAPYKSQSEYDNQLKSEVKAFASDSNWEKTYTQIYNNTYFAFTALGTGVGRGTDGKLGWMDYVPRIVTGTDYSSVIKSETSRYNSLLENIFKQK